MSAGEPEYDYESDRKILACLVLVACDVLFLKPELPVFVSHGQACQTRETCDGYRQ